MKRPIEYRCPICGKQIRTCYNVPDCDTCDYNDLVYGECNSVTSRETDMCHEFADQIKFLMATMDQLEHSVIIMFPWVQKLHRYEEKTNGGKVGS